MKKNASFILLGLLMASSSYGQSSLAVIKCHTEGKAIEVELKLSGAMTGANFNTHVVISKKSASKKKAKKGKNKDQTESYMGSSFIQKEAESNRAQKITVEFINSKQEQERFAIDRFTSTSAYEGIFRTETLYCNSEQTQDKETVPVDI